MADRKNAQQVPAATLQLMRRVAPVSSPTASVATPVFHAVNLSIVEHLLDATELSPGELAKRLAAPTGWICESCRASTAQHAVDLAGSERARSPSFKDAAAKQVQAGELPFLNGAEKPRTWANQIRAAHGTASAHLQTASNAAWSIENRRAL